MNIVLECDVILSKKLEAICESGEPISISISQVSGNKGRGIVRLTCKNGVSEKEISKIGETSLSLKVNSMTEDIQSMGEGRRYSNIVGGGIPESAERIIAQTSPDVPAGQPYVDRRPSPSPVAEVMSTPAAVANPATINAILTALAAMGVQIPSGQVPVTTGQVAPPVASRPVAPPRPIDNSIRNYDELMTELTSIPGVDAVPKMPTDRKLTPQEAERITSQLPRLRRKAYMRNALPSQLMIGDLFTTIDGGGSCLAMLPGAAYDLSRLPARNLLNSTDLRWCFETGKVELVDSATYAACFKKVHADAEQWGRAELPVFGGTSARLSPHDSTEGTAESLAAGSGMGDDKDTIHIGGQGSDPISISVGGGPEERPPEVPWEDSPQMQTLIGNMPRTREPSPPKPPRRI